MPNEAGVGQSSTNNFFSNAPGQDKNHRADVRLDQRISDRQLIYAHMDYFSNNILQNNYYGNNLASVNSNDQIPGFNVAVHHTWSISPSLVFDQHFSWAHSESDRTEPSQLTAADLGFPANIAPGLTGQMDPQLSASRISGLGPNYPIEFNASSVYQYAGDLSWIKGIHTFKFGFDLREYPVQLFDPQQLAISASQNFTGGSNPSSASADSGSGVADLLLGAASVTSGYVNATHSHRFYGGFFAQDTARVTRTLTLTYGLRLNYEAGDVENQNQLNYIDLKSANPLSGQVPGFPNLIGGVGIPGLNGTSDQLQIPRGVHLDPRLGVAYALDSKTVIHAGFGIFHHPPAAWQQFPNALGTTRASTSISAHAERRNAAVQLEQSISTGSSGGLRERRGTGDRFRPEHHRSTANAGYPVPSQLVVRYSAPVAVQPGGNSGICGQCRRASCIRPSNSTRFPIPISRWGRS